jgi:hypothetical protein
LRKFFRIASGFCIRHTTPCDQPFRLSPLKTPKLSLRLLASSCARRIPGTGEDAPISLKWLEAARVAKQPASNAPLFAGIDVAGPGEDETVLTIRRGACVVFQNSWVGERSSGHVLNELAKFGGPNAFRSVNIYSAGMGEYFCEIIEDANYSVNAVNLGAVSADPGRFNLRLPAQAEVYGLCDRCAV